MDKQLVSASFNRTDLANALLKGLPDALIVSDAAGRICFWNAGAERIFGFTEAEALGQSLDIIVPKNLRARHWEGYEHTMKTGQTRYGAGDLLAVPAICRDGRRISVQFSILPLPDADGKLTAIAAIMRDVTSDFEARKRLKSELTKLRQTNEADT